MPSSKKPKKHQDLKSLEREEHMPKLSRSKTSSKTKTMPQSKPASNRMKIEPSCGNVFKDLGFSDSEAANLIARCDLQIAVVNIIKKNKWTQKEAAKELKISQPRVAELMSFRTNYFSVDLLIKYLARLGVQVDFKFSKIDWN